MAVLLHLSFNTTSQTLFAMFPDLSEAAQYHIQWELGNIPGWVMVVLLLVCFGARHLTSNRQVTA